MWGVSDGLHVGGACRAADPTYVSPFALGARALGHMDIGGKMDDICVVIAYVVPGSKL